MEVLRGRAATPVADQRRTREMVQRVTETGEPGLRVWTPHRQVVFGRRDARSDGYEEARRRARQHDYPPLEREVGGRAVAYTGSTVAFTLAEPVEDHRTGIQARYDQTLDALERALASCDVVAERGEPEHSFCPGSHSLRTASGKVVGVAQRVRQDIAVVAGIVVVADDEAIATVLDPVYDALGVEFDPESVGSVVPEDANIDPLVIVRAIETAFVADREKTVTTIRKSA